MKPRLLDLFAGAGGAARGYQLAGFHVTGVDHLDQPNYCGDEFFQRDALTVLRGKEADRPPSGAPVDVDVFQDWLEEWSGLELGRFAAIHASPPCQAYTGMNRRWAESRAANPALISETRNLLQETGLPYVIENVGGAVGELINPTRLCGRSLGLPIHRHRLFECSFPVMAHECQGGRDPFGVYGKLDGRRLWTRQDGSELRAAATLKEARDAMGIDWMDWDELREAVPPAMTEHIGSFLLNAINAERSEAPRGKRIEPPTEFASQEAMRSGPRSYTPEQSEVIELAVQARRPLPEPPLPIDDHGELAS